MTQTFLFWYYTNFQMTWLIFTCYLRVSSHVESWRSWSASANWQRKQAVLQNLLLIHSWGRCDATYAFYGHRKCAIIKIIQKSESVLSCCKTLANHTAFYIQIASAGSQVVVKIMAESPVIGLPQIYQVYGVCCNIN